MFLTNPVHKLFRAQKPIIAVVYLEPCLGYDGFLGFEKTVELAIQEYNILKKYGVHGVLFENENDRPYTVKATPEAIASHTRIMTDIASEIGRQSLSKSMTHNLESSMVDNQIPIGFEFLINDPYASLLVAKASGCHFIRTDYFVDKMYRPEYGELSVDPEDLMNYRSKIKADNILVFADIQVKYAQMLEQKSIADSALQACKHGAAGALVSGFETGVAPSVEKIKLAKSKAPNLPILTGSGLSVENMSELLPLLDGGFVGSAFMINGRIVEDRVAQFFTVYDKLIAQA